MYSNRTDEGLRTWYGPIQYFSMTPVNPGYGVNLSGTVTFFTWLGTPSGWSQLQWRAWSYGVGRINIKVGKYNTTQTFGQFDVYNGTFGAKVWGPITNWASYSSYYYYLSAEAYYAYTPAVQYTQLGYYYYCM